MRRQHEHVYTWRSAPDSNRHTPFAKKEKKTTTSGNDKKQTSEFKHVILEHEQEIICIEDEQKKKKVWHHLVTAPYVTSTLWHWLCVHSDLWIAPSLAHGKKWKLLLKCWELFWKKSHFHCNIWDNINEQMCTPWKSDQESDSEEAKHIFLTKHDYWFHIW